MWIWVATGGRSGLNAKVDILEGRQILVFPDVDAYDYWKEKFSEHPRLQCYISDYLQRIATPDQPSADIADWLLRTRERPVGEDGRRHSRTFLEIQKYISPEVAGQFEALIDDLGQEFFGKVEVVKVEEPAEEENKAVTKT